ncbi:glycosyltransferase family 2 protein [Myxacorys almedinensis]|uniref:Glycosyltransferase n=1 Tax=Myxacorys almedinensis A TaxID=2690445 RepID=A0A8J7Z8F9_9CYAN|nr:glycosyltransferase family 2 protein [Myxacorys almedinensis]NDJ18313.1 glycosyltransferase [Myxacorys almedinensis A]
MPKISICIPTFNRAHLLPFAIESVVEQTEQDWELIVCDDGSSDRTPELLATYLDTRIHYIRHPKNIGKSNNMRSGFEAATGAYFIKFDDDDRLTPNFLSQTSQILDRSPTLDFVGTDHWIIDSHHQRDEAATEQNSQQWGRTNLPTGVVANLLEVVFVNQSFQIGATLFRRQALLDLGYMRPNIQNCEDNDLLVRLAIAHKQGYYLPQRLMEYRVHPEQQGIDRAIPYLKDKLKYLQNFQFEQEPLEKVRRSRLAETQLLLGLRLIEKGETQVGRDLVSAGRSASTSKALTGMALSVLPLGVRSRAFNLIRQTR